MTTRKLEATVELSPLILAETFSAMSDEDQAQFFIEAAHIFYSWGDANASMQRHLIAGHLVTCSCSNDEARYFVEDLAESLAYAMEKETK
jgi:hypothetical protein